MGRKLPALDAVIHAACDFSTGMGAIDRHLLDVLLPALASQPKRTRLIYTGGAGCSVRPATTIATEQTRSVRCRRLRGWCRICGDSSSARNRRRRDPPGDGLRSPMAGSSVASPATRSNADAIRVVGSEEVRWPLVHRADLARPLCAWRLSEPQRDRAISARRSRGLPSVASRAPLRSVSAHDIRNRKSFPPTRSRPNSATGREDMRLDQRLSGAKARRNLAGGRSISTRNVKLRARVRMADPMTAIES